MECFLEIRQTRIPYTIRRYTQSKHVRILIDRNGSVTVTGPARLPYRAYKAFVETRKDWIVAQVHERVADKDPHLIATSREHFLAHKEAAYTLATEKVEYWNQHYQYSFGKIAVKRLKSRWGSCSSNGNLSFNYKILFLPEVLQDYLVVHELCHLWEMNHSERFWRLVGQTIPNYRELRNAFRKL